MVRGSFEAHLTVEAETEERRAAFQALCAELGVKCVLIELARGVHRSQPMTSSHHTGDLAEVRNEIERQRGRLVAAGFAVSRVKIEAEVTNAGVPSRPRGRPAPTVKQIRLDGNPYTFDPRNRERLAARFGAAWFQADDA